MSGEDLLTRLWETIGTRWRPAVAGPWQIAREGHTLAEARRREWARLTRLEQDIEGVRRGDKIVLTSGEIRDLPRLEPQGGRFAAGPGYDVPAISLRSLERLTGEEDKLDRLQRAINLNKALLFAEEELVQCGDRAPAERVDTDWLACWRESAQRVSGEELQRLWARTLAGEIKAPGTYSLRTLDFLRNLTRREAELIAKVAPYVILGMVSKVDEAYLEQVGLGLRELLELDHLGVVSGVDSFGIKKLVGSTAEGRFFNYILKTGKILVFERETPEPPLELSGYKVTQIGAELLSLGHFEPDITFLEILGLHAKRQGFSVSLGDWVQEVPGQGSYRNARRL